MIKDFTNFNIGIRTFKTKYGFMPGDFPNASVYWSSVISAGNGNADGLINIAAYQNTPLEDTYFWNHLSLAGMINGNFIGGAQGTRYKTNVNIPASKLNVQAGYMVFNDYAFGISTNFIALGTENTNGFFSKGALTPADGFVIDKKMDDGIPSTGLILVHRGWDLDADATKCVNSSKSVGVTTDVSYLFNDQTLSCRIFNQIK